MKRIHLKLGARSYDTVVGDDIVDKIPGLVARFGTKRGFLVYDRRLAKAAGRLVRALTRDGWSIARHEVVAGEAAKDYRKVFPIYGKMIEHGMDRHSLVFALGGGVVGDLTGFLAGTYLRGVRWVGIPTTLLAQVDSSIGGKTGVNHPLGKNLIGVFHQPVLVVCDTKLLKTLDERDRISGIGEIVKYGLVFEPAFYKKLEKDFARLVRLEPKAIVDAVTRSVAWKSKVVARDEYETRGFRRRLNFGHTLGHALEGVTKYGYYRHGEAIIVGMRLATGLSVERGHLSEKEFTAIDRFLAAIPVPKMPKVKLADILAYTKRDKKAKAGKVTFILLSGVGQTVADAGVTETDIANAFARVKK